MSVRKTRDDLLDILNPCAFHGLVMLKCHPDPHTLFPCSMETFMQGFFLRNGRGLGLFVLFFVVFRNVFNVLGSSKNTEEIGLFLGSLYSSISDANLPSAWCVTIDTYIDFFICLLRVRTCIYIYGFARL